jgi:hypothetical protein
MGILNSIEDRIRHYGPDGLDTADPVAWLIEDHKRLTAALLKIKQSSFTPTPERLLAEEALAAVDKGAEHSETYFGGCVTKITYKGDT